MNNTQEPASRYFYSSSLKLHYLDWGNEDAPLLILVHGMHDHARSWDWVARSLCDQWHVVAVDLRGHGDSDWSPDGSYHTAYYLEDFVRLTEALGAEKFNIIAHSLGGNPSARFSGLYPERVKKLVLVDGMGPTRPALEAWDKQGNLNRSRDWLEKRQVAYNKEPRRFDSVDDAVQRMMAVHKNLSEEQARHLTEHGLRQHGNQYGWKYDPRAGLFHPEDFAIHLSEYWREIAAETLLCWGPKSWTTNPAEDGNAKNFKSVTTMKFEESGHWIHHDQTSEFVDSVRFFLLN
ncbi:alpha/beta fold hydrolase [Pseudomaricurvus sp. HS19]|uniref:alpha/beta fold hydrolase n=1 Tax=Pseudomaricurvus sp. HS19 TaxID=2692626 RepID=UPI0013709485|nr:alpha/beta hydrolase [Pseudomaricurvus sp. HS19]MYM63689.1 alpha/beta fold hydrolase [Pseudomaricurvus sp. HS19]